MGCILARQLKLSIGRCPDSRDKSRDNIIRLARLERSTISNGKCIEREQSNIDTRGFEQGSEGIPEP